MFQWKAKSQSSESTRQSSSGEDLQIGFQSTKNYLFWSSSSKGKSPCPATEPEPLENSHTVTEWLNRGTASGAPDLCPDVSTAANHTLALVLFKKHNHWSTEDLMKWHMQDMTWCFVLRSPGDCTKIPVLWQRLPEKMETLYDDFFAPFVLLLCRVEVSQKVFFAHFSCAGARTVSPQYIQDCFFPVSQIHSMRRFPQPDTRKTENKRWPRGLSWFSTSLIPPG